MMVYMFYLLVYFRIASKRKKRTTEKRREGIAATRPRVRASTTYLQAVQFK